MSWDYWKFPRHPVAAKIIEIRRGNTIILHFHYRVEPKLGKGVCDIYLIPCTFPACVPQLDKDQLSNCDPSTQPSYARIDNCYYNKLLKHYNDWVIMVFLDNKTPI